MNKVKTNRVFQMMALVVAMVGCDTPPNEQPIEITQASEDVREMYGIVAYEKSTDDNGVTAVRGVDDEERVVLEVRYGDGGLFWRAFAVEPLGADESLTVDESLMVDPEGHLVGSPVVNESMPAKMEEVLNDLTSGEEFRSWKCWKWGAKCLASVLGSGTVCALACASVAGCAVCVAAEAPGVFGTCEKWLDQCY